MTLTIVSTILILISLWTSYKDWKVDNSVIKKAYFQNLIDWPIALIIVFGVMLSFLILYSIDIPQFLTWSLFSLFGSESSGNVMFTPFTLGFLPITIIFYLVIASAVPYLAKSEEVIFRQYVFGVKYRIIKSIIFGFIHMLVGVPILAAIILSIVGYIYSHYYIKEFSKWIKIDPDTALSKALDRSTSIHAKYNFIVITFIFIVVLISN